MHALSRHPRPCRALVRRADGKNDDPRICSFWRMFDGENGSKRQHDDRVSHAIGGCLGAERACTPLCTVVGTRVGRFERTLMTPALRGRQRFELRVGGSTETAFRPTANSPFCGVVAMPRVRGWTLPPPLTKPSRFRVPPYPLATYKALRQFLGAATTHNGDHSSSISHFAQPTSHFGHSTAAARA